MGSALHSLERMAKVLREHKNVFTETDLTIKMSWDVLHCHTRTSQAAAFRRRNKQNALSCLEICVFI